VKKLEFFPNQTDIQSWLSLQDSSDNLEFVWLGQAGFLFKKNKVKIGIDPYLSNSLGEKYQGTHFPHIRMIEPPCEPETLATLDVLCSTHGHSDHLDPGTLGPLYRCKGHTPLFVNPRAEIVKAHERGVPLVRLVTMNVDETWTYVGNGAQRVEVSAIPAAHEGLRYDNQGNCLYLGYVIDFFGIRLFHSGDSIPYEGLVERLSTLDIDIAFLPVNGRDEYRSKHGVPGNFTIQEAMDIARSAKIPILVPHHFGLFEFNTVSPEEITAIIPAEGLQVVVPELSLVYRYLSFPNEARGEEPI
jgi:L-ascorbate metabolism protein UlaG (beta-lactamase superfamily)